MPSPTLVAFPVMESLIKQCLVVEIEERVDSVTSLMKQPVLWSLVEQLKNRIKPENLVFGLNRLETKDVIKDHLIAELQKKMEKMVDFMQIAQNKISKLETENKGLKEKVGFLFASPLEGFGLYNGNDHSASVRSKHDEAAVRLVLKAMAAGSKLFNLKELDKIAFLVF